MNSDRGTSFQKSGLRVVRGPSEPETMNDPPARILVVDDDAEIRTLVGRSLEKRGYQVVLAASVAEAEAAARRADIDLIVLDIMMPGEDGLSYCRRLSQADGPPILLLSALDDAEARIVGLEIGADSYLAKPCNPHELVATAKALLRRSRVTQERRKTGGRSAEFDGWRLDLMERVLRDPYGVVVDLSASEHALLRCLIDRPRRVLSREQLLDASPRDTSDVYDRSIDVQVSRLRRKLGADGARLIVTIRAEGYMFTPAVIRR
jgi:two-component system, OmpR family, response regulator